MTKKIRMKPFFIEIFFVLVTLTFSSAILTFLYVGVAKSSRDSSDKQTAMFEVQSELERFCAAETKEEGLKALNLSNNKTAETVGYDKDWHKLSKNAYFTLTKSITAKETDSGELLSVDIKVERGSLENKEAFYSVSTKKYFAEVG